MLAGASMGAHTALRFALEHPELVAALALITPARSCPAREPSGELARWDALARGLREGGVEGFVRAYDLEQVPDALARAPSRRCCASGWPPTSTRRRSPTRWKWCRARARSSSLAQLHGDRRADGRVASRDEADPGHPLAVGERYAQRDPRRASCRRGRRDAAALADRVAGRAALEGARRARRAGVTSARRAPLLRRTPPASRWRAGLRRPPLR